MPYIIIAIIILVIGAAAEITVYVFTDKLLKKREKGLDLREDAIVEAEGELDSREIQLDRREDEIAEREKKLPQGVLPGDPIKVVTVNRPIRKFRAKACVELDRIFNNGAFIDADDAKRKIECYTEQIKDGLRDRICKDVRNMVTFSALSNHWNREIIAELWVAEGGPDDGVS